MSIAGKKRQQLLRRKRRVRKSVFGTADRPRLSVKRTLKNISVQVIDDDLGATICQASTSDKSFQSEAANGGNRVAAADVGKLIAARAKEKGIESVAFDRNGRRFHGRLKALADAAREGGLKF